MISTTEITEELKSHPILRHAPSLLKKWKGKEARLFNLSENHRKIQLRISEDRYLNDISCFLISMHEPITMKGHFDWDNASIEIEYHDTYYKVVDAKNRFEIICNNISITECK